MNLIPWSVGFSPNYLLKISENLRIFVRWHRKFSNLCGLKWLKLCKYKQYSMLILCANFGLQKFKYKREISLESLAFSEPNKYNHHSRNSWLWTHSEKLKSIYSRKLLLKWQNTTYRIVECIAAYKTIGCFFLQHQ